MPTSIPALVVSLGVALCFCYLLCGIPFGLLVAKVKGVDVRRVGSHNIGTTNVARSVGGGAGIITLLGDVLKAFISIILCRFFLAKLLFDGDFFATAPKGEFAWIGALLFLACIVGHVFSIYLRFHGGKGIAVGLGATLALSWILALLMLAVFFLVSLPSRYVSAGSLAANFSLIVWWLILGYSLVALPFLIAVCLLVAWSHRENIAKLLSGKESKFKVHHSADQKK